MLSRAVLVLAVLLLLGCPQGPGVPSGVVPADPIPAARYLPATVQLVAVTENLGRLLRVVGRDEIATRLRERYEQEAFELGYDVFSPEGLADVGVDLRSQAGIALLAEPGDPTIAVFVTLAEPERFKNVVYMLARARVPGFRATMSVVKDAVVVGTPETAVTLVGRSAIFLLGPRAFALAQELARQPAREALSNQPAFKKAMGDPEPGRPLRGYFDLRAWLYLQAGLDPRWPGTSEQVAAELLDKRHRAALAEARNEGARLAEIMAIDRSYRTARNALSGDEFGKRIRKLAGDIGGGRFSVGLRPTGADATIELDLPKKSVLRRLFTPRTGTPMLVRALDRPPALMATLSLDLKTVLEVASTLELPLPELSLLFGIDLETQLAPLLSGEVGLALSAPGGDLAKVEGAADLGVAAVIGVKDAARTEAFLQKLLAGGLKTVLHAKGKRAWTMNMPEVGTLSVRLTDQALVVSRDAQASERISRAKSRLPQRRPFGVLGRGNAGTILVQLAALAALELEAAEPAKASIPWHDPKAPKSADYEKTLAELQKVEAALSALEGSRRMRDRRRKLTLLEPLGHVAGALTTTPRGLALQASYRTNGPSVVSILAAYDRYAEPVDDFRLEEDSAKELRRKRDLLEADLDAIYTRDRNAQQPPTQ